ncbi:RNA polymerase sigma factor SigX [Texcoconibacillus texcoconensis]|uniref:RNA polymerase sigma factor n=1 Tax=Texcoconibacillus texcoconensis TaxID=1095777 RepID=A0A840QSE3_9BACI|nr:RNA polymerase sigma-70 factor (ECF subfamily) [Texcoconibacillus texcoconensis]
MHEKFERIYDHYHQMLFQYIFYMVRNREVAEELVQEVYIKVLHSYDEFKGESSEKTWLYSIAKHVAVDWIRKQNRQKRRWLGKWFDVHERDFEVSDSEPLPEEIVIQRDEMKDVYKQLRRCRIDQQQVIVLRYLQGLSINETAEVLGWTESKVKTTQHRAIQKLKKHLSDYDDQELKEVSR